MGASREDKTGPEAQALSQEELDLRSELSSGSKEALLDHSNGYLEEAAKWYHEVGKMPNSGFRKLLAAKASYDLFSKLLTSHTIIFHFGVILMGVSSSAGDSAHRFKEDFFTLAKIRPDLFCALLAEEPPEKKEAILETYLPADVGVMIKQHFETLIKLVTDKAAPDEKLLTAVKTNPFLFLPIKQRAQLETHVALLERELSPLKGKLTGAEKDRFDRVLAKMEEARVECSNPLSCIDTYTRMNKELVDCVLREGDIGLPAHSYTLFQPRFFDFQDACLRALPAEHDKYLHKLQTKSEPLGMAR